jgi:hypothetical protein
MGGIGKGNVWIADTAGVSHRATRVWLGLGDGFTWADIFVSISSLTVQVRK